MGKKKNASSGLGRSIIKARFGGRTTKTKDSFLHTSELKDGYDWGRLNLQSITEQSHLEDFLSTAQLAGTEFTAEKLNVKFVNPDKDSDLLSPEEEKIVKDVQEKHKQLLRIPRRPEWDEQTTAEELDKMERDQFLEWRRELAQLQDLEHIILTPFERNLDFWRQLWRVIERSDIIVQIVDGRNPLLFRCEDLERYVNEIDDRKMNMILVNKADLLTAQQRKMWATYFDNVGVRVAFWSATLETERQNEKEAQCEEEDSYESTDNDDSELSDNPNNDINPDNRTCVPANTYSTDNNEAQQTHCEPYSVSDSAITTQIDRTSISDNVTQDTTESKNSNSSALLDGEELVELFKHLYCGDTVLPGVITIGLVGYPNVGKSSTINAILRTKKVPVSATPGRTKHFQTLYLDSSMMLCDCPGLVMPTFVSTKADMVVSGILPIDQMRDHIPPVSLVCQLIHRDTLEATYTINIPPPMEGEDPNRPPTANELLMAYGYNRGYMTSRGIPDCPRSSRYILKDYVNGKLLYCHYPPGCDVDVFQPTPATPQTKTYMKIKERHMKAQEMADAIPMSHIDRSFFTKVQHNVHSKGVHGVNDFKRLSGFTGLPLERTDSLSSGSAQSISGKPWKKHGNKNRKEKGRRIYKGTTDIY